MGTTREVGGDKFDEAFGTVRTGVKASWGAVSWGK